MTAPTLAQRVAERLLPTARNHVANDDMLWEQQEARDKALAEFVLAADDCAGISTSDDIARYDAALSALARALGVEE